jgi:hypothetical protein
LLSPKQQDDFLWKSLVGASMSTPLKDPTLHLSPPPAPGTLFSYPIAEYTCVSYTSVVYEFGAVTPKTLDSPAPTLAKRLPVHAVPSAGTSRDDIGKGARRMVMLVRKSLSRQGKTTSSRHALYPR